MAGMPWIRLWTEARTDLKLRSLKDDEFRVWFNLLCFAAEQEERGVIHADAGDFRLAVEVAGGDDELLARTLDRLNRLNVIALQSDTILFVHFEERQFEVKKPRKPSDSKDATAKRAKKYRDQQESGVYARDGRACHFCGATDVPLHITRLVPRRLGGSAALENLVARCDACRPTKSGDADRPEEGRIAPENPASRGITRASREHHAASREHHAHHASITRITPPEGADFPDGAGEHHAASRGITRITRITPPTDTDTEEDIYQGHASKEVMVDTASGGGGEHAPQKPRPARSTSRQATDPRAYVVSEGGLALLDWWVEQTAWHLADRSRQDYEWAADRLLGKAGSLTEAQDYLRWRISLGRCDLKYMPNDYLPTWRANNSAKPRQLTPSEVFRAFAEGKSVEEIEDESARGVARTGSPLVSLPAPLPRNPKGA